MREQIYINLQYTNNKILFQKCNSSSMYCWYILKCSIPEVRGPTDIAECMLHFEDKANTKGDAVFILTSERVLSSTLLFCGFLWKNTETVLQDVYIEIYQGMWHFTLNSCSKITVSGAKCVTSCMTYKLMFPWHASTARPYWKVFLESLLSMSSEWKIQDTCWRDPGMSEFTEAVETGIPLSLFSP